MSSASFVHGPFAVLLSENEQTIYIKLTDTVNFMCFEDTLGPSDFPFNLSLHEYFVILQKCFEQSDDNFVVSLSASSIMADKRSHSVGSLKLKVNALVGGIVRVGFEIFVSERIWSNDGKLTVNFNRLEQKQDHDMKALTQKFDQLTHRCETLEAALETQREEFFRIIDRLDVLLFAPHHVSHENHFTFALPKISSDKIEINCGQFGASSHLRFQNLSIFYKLKQLKLLGFVSKSNLKDLSNDTLVELELNCGSNGTFTSLEGFTNFPSLTTLTVITAPGLANVVQTLKSAPHKIKTIKFQGCTGVNVVELQTYCQENKIFLALS